MPTASQGFGSLLWFFAVLAMIPLVLWLLKRTPLGGAASGQAVMRSVAALPLSSSQRIVTIEVGTGAARRWLVLGVTAQSITALHEMEPASEAPPPSLAAGTTPFAQMMGRLRGDRSASDGR